MPNTPISDLSVFLPNACQHQPPKTAAELLAAQVRQRPDIEGEVSVEDLDRFLHSEATDDMWRSVRALSEYQNGGYRWGRRNGERVYWRERREDLSM